MKQYFSHLTMILLSLFGLVSVSCVETEPTAPVVPAFPDAVTQSLEAGESYTIEFEPNADWIVEINFTKESAGWFWIQNGNQETYTVRGKAGAKASVTVCAGGQTDYDKVHSCTLDMTMGGETRTVGTFTRGTVERSFSLACCQLQMADYADIVYDFESKDPASDSKLKYAYEEALEGENPLISLPWIDRTDNVRRSIVVSANFDWHFKSLPEWLDDVQFTGADAGEQVEFDIKCDPLYYSLENRTEELVFCAKKNTEAEYRYSVEIQGCGNIFKISGFQPETQANADGDIYQSGMGETWIDAGTGISGEIIGTEDMRTYTFVYYQDIFNSYWDSDPMNTGWISVNPDPWNAEGGLLQTRGINIKVAANDGPERVAYVFAMPVEAAPEEAYQIFPDGQTMDPKYEAYVLTSIIQEAFKEEEPEPGPDDPEVPAGSEIVFADPDAVTGATLEHVTVENLGSMIEKYPQITELNENVAGNGYEVVVLSYTAEYPENAALVIPANEWIDIKPGVEGPEWLSMSDPVSVDGKLQTTFTMTEPAEGAPEYGFVNIYKTMTEIKAVIYCIPAFANGTPGPDEPDVPDVPDVPDEPEIPEITSEITFETPDLVVGARIDYVNEKNIAEMIAKYEPYGINSFEEDVLGMKYDVAVLTYTSANPENVRLNVPSSNQTMVMPWSGVEWLTFEKSKVGLQNKLLIRMAKPAEDEKKVAMFQFYKTATEIGAIIYCIPEF